MQSSYSPAEQAQLPGFAQGFGLDGEIKKIVAQRPEFDQLFNRPPQSPRREDHASEFDAVTTQSRHSRSLVRVAFQPSLRRGRARTAPCSRHHSPASRVASRSPVRTDNPLSSRVNQPPPVNEFPAIHVSPPIDQSSPVDTDIVVVARHDDPSHAQRQAPPGTSQANATGRDWNKLTHPSLIGANSFERPKAQVCGAIVCCCCVVSAVGGVIYAIAEYA